MAKEKAPAYQRYPKDYLSDIKVQAMNLEEEGMYNRLMDYCWCETSLPSDPAILAALCKGSEPTPLVLSCFTEIDGELHHKRLDEERGKQAEWRAKSAEGGKRSAHKRKHPKAKPPQQGGATTVEADRLKGGGTLQSSSASSSANIKRERGIKSHICPDGFQPSDQDMRWAIETRPDLDVERETLKFRNYEFKNPKSDWPRTWKNWILNAEANQSNKPKSQKLFEVL